LAAFIGNMVNVIVSIPKKWGSPEHQQSIGRVSTILGIASCIIQGPYYGIYLQSMYWQALWAKEKATWSHPQSKNEHLQSVNDFEGCILCHPRAVRWLLSIIEVLAAFIGNMDQVNVASPDNEHQQNINRASTERQQSINRASTEHQQSVNRASTEHQQSINRASTEHQQSWVLHLV